MPPIKGNIPKYTEDDVVAAIAECKRGVPTAVVARKFKIPRVTLLNKARGKCPIKRKMGRQCYISEETEEMLVKWAKAMLRLGFPITKIQLQDSVKKIVDDLHLETPFKGGRPGKKWYSSFLKRHPDLITRQPQNLTSSRASVTKPQLKKWFSEVESYIQDNKLDAILKDPRRIFNMDETAFFLNPKGNKVLAPKGEKSIYQQINSDEKECYTVLLGGNAIGEMVPPMILFKYERIPKDVSLSIPQSWGIGRSENGWMTSETFFEYITNIFNKWLNENKIQKPVILFMDGHTSHLSYHISKFCSDNGIILIALYPNATHVLQPMDVSVFRSLKGSWKDAVHAWRLENIDTPILRKTDFCPLLSKVIADKLVPSILQSGFRKCGLYPWDPDAVCSEPAPSVNELSDLQKLAIRKELQMGMKFVEKHIDTDKLKIFKSCNEWNGKEEDKSLFKFYKKIENLLKECNNHKQQNGEPGPNDGDVDSETLTEDSKQTQGNGELVVNDVEVYSETVTDGDTYLNGNEEQPSSFKEITGTSSPITNTVALNSDDDMPPISHQTQNEQIYDNIPVPSTPEHIKDQANITKIPTPFKRAIFWPTPKQNLKKRVKEKVPAVISSLQWQLYHENKEKKKLEQESLKKKRTEERKKKKEENEKLKGMRAANKAAKKNQKARSKTKKIDCDSETSEEEEWIESGDSLDDISICEQEEEEEDDELSTKEGPNCDTSEFKQGDYIVVNFPGKKRFHKYVCIIQKVIDIDSIEVMAMVSCDESKILFKENESDISIINESQIVKVLPLPAMIRTGDRIKYRFDAPLEVDG